MKVFAVADVHFRENGNDTHRLDELREKLEAATPDVIVDVGDHTSFGRGGSEWRTYLNHLAKRIPVLMLLGNHDLSRNVFRAIEAECSLITVLTKPPAGLGAYQFQDIMFFGIDYYLREHRQDIQVPQDMDILQAISLVKSTRGVRETILLSHYPPMQAKSVFPEVAFEPSFCYTSQRIIDALHIRRCIHGHLHTPNGEPRLLQHGGLQLINPGPRGFLLNGGRR